MLSWTRRFSTSTYKVFLSNDAQQHTLHYVIFLQQINTLVFFLFLYRTTSCGLHRVCTIKSLRDTTPFTHSWENVIFSLTQHQDSKWTNSNQPQFLHNPTFYLSYEVRALMLLLCVVDDEDSTRKYDGPRRARTQTTLNRKSRTEERFGKKKKNFEKGKALSGLQRENKGEMRIRKMEKKKTKEKAYVTAARLSTNETKSNRTEVWCGQLTWHSGTQSWWLFDDDEEEYDGQIGHCCSQHQSMRHCDWAGGLPAHPSQCCEVKGENKASKGASCDDARGEKKKNEWGKSCRRSMSTLPSPQPRLPSGVRDEDTMNWKGGCSAYVVWCLMGKQVEVMTYERDEIIKEE